MTSDRPRLPPLLGSLVVTLSCSVLYLAAIVGIAAVGVMAPSIIVVTARVLTRTDGPATN